MHENPKGKTNMGIECKNENQELENGYRENLNKSVNDSNAMDIGKVSTAISFNSERQEKRRVSEHEDDLENHIPEDENKSSPRPRVLTTPDDDPHTPDRPGRPSVPTPGKYGTQYGGAPSPGPTPSSAFLPPGFVPPTPPVTSNRHSLTRCGTLIRKCLSSSLMTEDNCQEGMESKREVKKIRLNDKPSFDIEKSL